MRFSRPMFLSGLMVLVESENTHDNNKSPFLCHLPRNVLQLYDIYGITVNTLPQGDLLIESPLDKRYRKVASADDRPACLALYVQVFAAPEMEQHKRSAKKRWQRGIG
jgi:hypothetical protein